MNDRNGILIVDDDPGYLGTVERVLVHAGIGPVTKLADGAALLDAVETLRPEAVCMDLSLGQMDGREALAKLKRNWPDLGVVVMAGRRDLSTAVECLRLGAGDFLPKPFGADALVQAIRRVRDGGAPEPLPESDLDAEEPAPIATFSELLGNSAAIREVVLRARSLARSTLPILVTGETGTGKDLVARAIHRFRHPDAPFVAVNTAGLDDTMFTDTLFGHLGGSFTGGERPRAGLIEEAGEGTLFLDEIGDLSPASQVKLLRLLQESEYFPIGSDRPKRSRCRFVVATHQDLAHTPGFRSDLYWRLQAHPVRVPPLRERREDIPLLFRHFAHQAAREMARRYEEPSDAFLADLARLDFPGNVRELRGLAYDLVARDEGYRIDLDRNDDDASTEKVPDDEASSFPTLSELESRHIQLALRRTGGNRTLAADLLGISRQTLLSRLKKNDLADCPDP